MTYLRVNENAAPVQEEDKIAGRTLGLDPTVTY